MKFNEAAGKLANLEYRTYNLTDLMKICNDIDNLKEKTLSKLQVAKQYDKKIHTNLVELKSLKVDVRYQRKMRLQLLLNKLKKENGFMVEAAGHVDVALRPDGSYFVWDGFRRSLMASLAGMSHIPCSVYVHPKNRTIKECVEYEAKMFKIRNADSEKMKPEEIFRSEVVYNDPYALEFLDFLRECNLNIEGLNPGFPDLGGFVQTYSSWKNWIDEENMILSSKIIQTVWPNDGTVSGYLLCGLGKFLDANAIIDHAYSEEEIIEFFDNYVNLVPPKKQDSLTKHRLSGLANESIAYSIATNVFKMNKKQLKNFVDALGLDDFNAEMLDSLN